MSLPPKAVASDNESSVLHRSLLEKPCEVTSSNGSYLELTDGKKILDACGGAAVAILGHGNREVKEAIHEQLDKVSYVHTGTYTTSAAEDLAKCILSPDGTSGFDHGLKKVFFVSSGSEANDAALKCALQYWYEMAKSEDKRSTKKFFISRLQAYHGGTVGAMSVSGMKARKAPYYDGGILLNNVRFVGTADAFHGKQEGESNEDFVNRLVEEVEDEIKAVGAENIISFIGETVSGAALACTPAPPGYWRRIRGLCTQHGILLHLDEVMCGMGRTGTYFAFEQEGIQPDIVTIGKGLGGGYQPIAAMLINDKIIKGLRKGNSAFNHGQTYQAHPVACAAALAVQNIIKQNGLIQRVAEKGKELGTMLDTALENCEYVADIRGRGLFWGVEFMKDKGAKLKQPFPRNMRFAERVHKAAFELGVAVYPGFGTVDGVEGDHVLLAPPYNMSDEELREAVDVLRMAYERTARDVDTESL